MATISVGILQALQVMHQFDDAVGGGRISRLRNYVLDEASTTFCRNSPLKPTNLTTMESAD